MSPHLFAQKALPRPFPVSVCYFSLDAWLFIKVPQSIWPKCDISIIVKTNINMDMDTNIIVNIDNNGRLQIGLEPLNKNTYIKQAKTRDPVGSTVR